MHALKKTNSNSHTKTANGTLTRSFSSTSANPPSTTTPRTVRKSKTPTSFSSSLPNFSYNSYSNNTHRPNSNNSSTPNDPPKNFKYRQVPPTLSHDRLHPNDHESLVKIVARLHEANYNPSITQAQTTPQTWAPEFQDDDQMQEAEGLVSQIDNEVNGWLQPPKDNTTQQYYSKPSLELNGRSLQNH
eukprot:TRINITY_DN14309_c0_g1_i1.p1 TRINITY_DN14309_c0_g1~~TRINITY_DN14309_c0_g1_i1.p1  ORF type:complete len:187 (-),score=46.68 TRINITY_DN14309_c0_g1_i1:105-665(-)